MTREENLYWLNKEIEGWENECQSKHPIKEALYAARKALEQETTTTVVIPKGATNKDVFKVIFGYEPATDAVICNKEDWCGASEPCNYCMSNPNSVGREEEWWDALYKGGQEDGKA